MAFYDGKCIGSIVSKLEAHTKNSAAGQSERMRGYIAMLSVEPEFRKQGIGKQLVKRSIELMI